MILSLVSPRLASRSCKSCWQFVYNDRTGEVERFPAITGEPIRRPRGAKPPCGSCLKGGPDAGRELTEQNWRAWMHYKECQAVGIFPDDAIVARNAAIIRSAEEMAELKVNSSGSSDDRLRGDSPGISERFAGFGGA